ncbi:MAG: sodium:solute symporter [Prevotella sp.]
MTILITILIYFGILLLFSRFTSRHADNETFFRAHKRSPWYMVAFGMVGASISGVTFVSVPGMVMQTQMTYLQTCLGFILGYFLVAFVLLPVYYRLNLTTIYTYLLKRLGRTSYKTGATFFVISKLTGAAVRFFVVCFILQRFLLDAYHVPFWLTVVCLVALIWLYSRRGGIKTLVWTDTFQTFCMLGALLLIIWHVLQMLDMNVGQAVTAIAADEHSRIFVFDDWVSKQNFWKQFFSGAFIVVVMTGLDQDMMQKNLTCKSLHDAQKDMCTYGFAFVPVNLLFMSLGVLLLLLAQRQGIDIPAKSDDLLPMFAATGRLGEVVVVLFTIGIVAACFSSADSALTALTTTICVDIVERKNDEHLRKRIHLFVALVFTLFILLFRYVNSTSLIDAIYVLCSYTYGPLLGLFAFGLFTRRKTNEKWVPYIAIAAPIACYLLNNLTTRYLGYQFGYELLLLNGLLTFCGLFLAGKRQAK